FGAEGIGLCRTEHMFFQGDRIQAVREMILADTPHERQAALAKILPMQREDFIGIFRAMDGLPVTIRLIDPPLHEFLPRADEDMAQFAATAGIGVDVVRRLVDRYTEQNPMLGFRGVRLSVAYPEIIAMQVRAIFEAAAEATHAGVKVRPEVMVPLVADVKELARLREAIRRIAEQVMAEADIHLPYLIGTMIELPRAC